MGDKRKPDPSGKMCESCGQRMRRKRNSSGRLEDYGDFMRRLFCNTTCMGNGQRKGGTSYRRRRGQ